MMAGSPTWKSGTASADPGVQIGTSRQLVANSGGLYIYGIRVFCLNAHYSIIRKSPEPDGGFIDFGIEPVLAWYLSKDYAAHIYSRAAVYDGSGEVQ